MQTTDKIKSTKYLLPMSICFALFLFRIIAQLIQKLYGLPFLPPFEKWYRGVLAYPWLLTSQLSIIALMGWVILGFAKDTVPAFHRLGIALIVLGSIYLSVMLLRLIAGLTFATHHHWLGALLPAFFHIVLATFVLLVGHFHLVHGKISDDT
jgi:uncharacterized protein